MATSGERGFSLIELMIVLVVLGLIIGYSIPSFQRFSSTLQLRGASENIAGQLRLAREKAIATGVVQPVSFRYGYLGESDYRTTPASGVGGSWRLPRGVTYAWGSGAESTYVFQKDGRCDRSGLIVLQNKYGHRDTVSVLLSGFVSNH
ncbi:MAG: prepilin-type N-terminal cleavage/methylation domain-containing protein [Phycisphaerae bacterium]|nr:prepilin-type N-terminal cleavage/methylation domain-containing protein [Phycisphaerae bacterium]